MLIELRIKFDGKKSVYVYAPETAEKQLCGLCGLYDGNRTNDLTTYAGVQMSDIFTFGNAWLDPEDTRDIAPVPRNQVHPCATLARMNPVMVSWISFGQNISLLKGAGHI